MTNDLSKHPDFQHLDPGVYEVSRHSGLRKLMADRLTQSKRDVPHFYVEMDCRTAALAEARARINGAAQPDTKVTLNDLLIKAVGMALVDVPEVNVSWSDQGLVRYRRADVGVAVAVTGGILVPHVEDVPSKDVPQISREMKALIERAQRFRLHPLEYSGRATSISNLGMYGVKSFSAIVNPPNSTMLAFGAVRRQPSEQGLDDVLTVTASVDHRAVDGVAAARFVAAIRDRIEGADFR